MEHGQLPARASLGISSAERHLGGEGRDTRCAWASAPCLSESGPASKPCAGQAKAWQTQPGEKGQRPPLQQLRYRRVKWRGRLGGCPSVKVRRVSHSLRARSAGTRKACGRLCHGCWEAPSLGQPTVDRPGEERSPRPRTRPPAASLLCTSRPPAPRRGTGLSARPACASRERSMPRGPSPASFSSHICRGWRALRERWAGHCSYQNLLSLSRKVAPKYFNPTNN